MAAVDVSMGYGKNRSKHMTCLLYTCHQEHPEQGDQIAGTLQDDLTTSPSLRG